MAPVAMAAPLYLDEDLMDALLHVLPEGDARPPPAGSAATAAELSSPASSEQSSSSTEKLRSPEPQLMASDSFADFIESVSFNDEEQSKETDELAGVPRKRPRSGRRQELDCLRDESDALERTLSQLRKRSDTRQPGTGHFWEQVAHRIMVEKRQALRENARLRSLIREQVDSVKVLQIAVGKTPELSVRTEGLFTMSLISDIFFVLKANRHRAITACDQQQFTLQGPRHLREALRERRSLVRRPGLHVRQRTSGHAFV